MISHNPEGTTPITIETIMDHADETLARVKATIGKLEETNPEKAEQLRRHPLVKILEVMYVAVTRVYKEKQVSQFENSEVIEW